MVEETRGPPAARRLLKRLSVPSSAEGLESISPSDVEPSPTADAQERLEAAKRLLKRLAAGHPDVDETIVDRIIADAEEALRKLGGDGEGAGLTDSEAFGLEAVIESDGSRPVLFVQDGTIDLDAPDLQESLAARWQGAAAGFLSGIQDVAAAVGGVQLPAFENKRFGTAFAIKPGYVLTNRHVLEEVARLVDGKWQWKYAVEVDFLGEYERSGENKFPLGEVVLWGPRPINRRINFDNLDYAVVKVGGDLSRFPRPLSFERDVDRVVVRDGRQPAIYVVGFPAKPLLAPGQPDGGAPAAGHEYEQVLEKLYQGRFGSKRWAPGLVEAGAGQLAGDARAWVMSHDASTLGGNSGSCVVDFANSGERVVGLHFGGRPRVENYAHVIAALQEELSSLTGFWHGSNAMSSQPRPGDRLETGAIRVPRPGARQSSTTPPNVPTAAARGTNRVPGRGGTDAPTEAGRLSEDPRSLPDIIAGFHLGVGGMRTSCCYSSCTARMTRRDFRRRRSHPSPPPSPIARRTKPRPRRAAEAEAEVEEMGLEAIGGDPTEVAARVSPRAFGLIVRHETGGPAHYERVIRKRATWPGHRSGITIGFGYDLGYATAAEFERDWGAALAAADRAALARCVGRHGGAEGAEAMRALLAGVRHIVVEWPVAEAVFRAATLPKFAARTNQALPNCEALHPDSFGALVSLTFNRGASYRAEGDRYAEMRAIQAAMEARRFADIPHLIRAMRRIWAGTEIETEMRRRRENEAALFEAGLAAMPDAPLAAPAVIAGAADTVAGLEARGGTAAASPIPAGAETWTGAGDEENWQPFTEEDAAAAAEDPDAEIGLESIGAAGVVWAPDAESPDYAHLQALAAPAATDFTLAATDLALLAAVNAFPVETAETPVLFGLRGAAIVRDHAAGGAEPVLRDQRPDHRTLRCVLGVWDRAAGRVSVFPGSTVPDRRAVVAWRTKRTSGNLLATGLYRYVVGVHNGRPGCFLLRDGAGAKRVVVVCRSSDDLLDLADHCAPGDNIHPTFFSAPVDFSSFGCQTVVGSADNAGSHRGPWADFGRAAGLRDGTGTSGRTHLYMLLTGREARLASLLRRQGLSGDPGAVAALRRLRFGSWGPAVQRLQTRLGLAAPDGDFGPVTAEALHAFQRRLPPGGRSDGIWSPALDVALCWDILATAPRV